LSDIYLKSPLYSVDLLNTKLPLGDLLMVNAKQKRTEERLQYHWFIQFANNIKEPLSQGRLVDLSSGGASFICYANNKCPAVGKLVTTYFSVPRFDSKKPFDTSNFNRIGRVCRVDDENEFLRRVAVQFAKPLPFKPGEQPISKYDRIYKLVTNSDGLKPSLNIRFNSDLYNNHSF